MKEFRIKANKDLIDATGCKCFSKGETYIYTNYQPVRQKHQLMNKSVKNDQGVKHEIGIWYKHFTLID